MTDAGSPLSSGVYLQENDTRIGYSKGQSAEILKREGFARGQAGEKLPDAALCKAVREIEDGLIDADLGGQACTTNVVYFDSLPRPSTEAA